MQNGKSTLGKPRVAFLLLLAISISLLFFWVIKDFVLAILMAAVLAGLVHPLYCRVAERLGGRNVLASAATVLLSLVMVIIPLLVFLSVVVGEAIQISKAAGDWVSTQVESGSLQQQLEADPDLKQLLPYQDEILEKAGQLAARAGTWVAQGLAAGAKGTAAFFLTLFVLLYGMFYFLIEGRGILDAALRYTPLSVDDESRLLGIFVSVSRATLKGKLIIGIVQGGLAGLSFWIAGIEGVFFWSAVMMVLSIIPAIGAALVWVPAVVFLFLNGQTTAAIGVGLWCALVVGTIDNVLAPMLIGKDTEMPDLLVMLTTLGGLAAFGAAGIIIGPIIGALYVAVWQLWGSAMDEARVEAGIATTNSGEG